MSEIGTVAGISRVLYDLTSKPPGRLMRDHSLYSLSRFPLFPICGAGADLFWLALLAGIVIGAPGILSAKGLGKFQVSEKKRQVAPFAFSYLLTYCKLKTWLNFSEKILRHFSVYLKRRNTSKYLKQIPIFCS